MTQTVAPPRMAHVVLRTTNFKEMQDFWITLLEAEIAYRNDTLCFLRYDDEHHRIAIISRPQFEPREPSRVTPGLDHVAFTYESFDDLFETYRRLRDQGILPVWSINHGPTLSMYYSDPDGNRAELQIDLFDTVEAANDFLASDVFDKNPVGIEFDPEELLRRRADGEEVETLVAYGSSE